MVFRWWSWQASATSGVAKHHAGSLRFNGEPISPQCFQDGGETSSPGSVVKPPLSNNIFLFPGLGRQGGACRDKAETASCHSPRKGMNPDHQPPSLDDFTQQNIDTQTLVSRMPDR